MSGISTHILDTSRGRPAPGVQVLLEAFGTHPDALTGSPDLWQPLADLVTDADGRCRLLPPETATRPGIYRLTFLTGPYFAAQHLPTLYPEISITFTILEGEQNYHIPLLLTPHSYTTYRGT